MAYSYTIFVLIAVILLNFSTLEISFFFLIFFSISSFLPSLCGELRTIIVLLTILTIKSQYLQSQSTLERKKKTLSFSRKFPFMKSREDGKSEDGSDQERKYLSLYIVYTK